MRGLRLFVFVIPVLAIVVGVGGLWLVPGPAPSRAADFELADHRGDQVALRDLRGQPAVVTFLYTNCPDVCPLYLGHIFDAVGDSDAGSRTAVLVIAVDPARDTQEHLAGFASSWPASWHFLTGRETDLARVWSAYGVTVESEASADAHHDSSYSVTHTAKAVVIDGAGYVVSELRGRWDSNALTAALEQAEAGARRTSSFGGRGPLADLVARCGEFASMQPWAFAGLVALIMFPGLVLPAYLLVTFLRTPAPPGTGRDAPSG